MLYGPRDMLYVEVGPGVVLDHAADGLVVNDEQDPLVAKHGHLHGLGEEAAPALAEGVTALLAVGDEGVPYDAAFAHEVSRSIVY